LQDLTIPWCFFKLPDLPGRQHDDRLKTDLACTAWQYRLQRLSTYQPIPLPTAQR